MARTPALRTKDYRSPHGWKSCLWPRQGQEPGLEARRSQPLLTQQAALRCPPRAVGASCLLLPSLSPAGSEKSLLSALAGSRRSGTRGECGAQQGELSAKPLCWERRALPTPLSPSGGLPAQCEPTSKRPPRGCRAAAARGCRSRGRSLCCEGLGSVRSCC